MKPPDISNCFGGGPKMLFSVDTKSKHGKIIMHFVQFHTLHVDDDGHFNKETMKTLSAETDLRLDHLSELLYDRQSKKKP